ncbi:MAG: hypothetical protein AB7P04_08795 [Bacteriovoracia bacterium]
MQTKKFLIGVWMIFAMVASVASAAAAERHKVIDFEDELVEGVNKKPLDSLSTLSEKEKKRRRLHLYRKRVGFSSETADSLKEMRYAQ